MATVPSQSLELLAELAENRDALSAAERDCAEKFADYLAACRTRDALLRKRSDLFRLGFYRGYSPDALRNVVRMSRTAFAARAPIFFRGGSK